MKLAYIVSRFPQLSETFIVRELDALERLGFEIVLCPLIRQEEAVSQPAALRWQERCIFTPFVSGPLLRAAARTAARRPIRLTTTFTRALSEVATTPNFLAGTAGIALKSIYLARQLEQLGVTHVHAHFATHPTMAAWLIKRLSGIGYSFTAHAHDIYVHQAMLRQKVADADFVVTISRANQELLEGMGGDGKTQLVHCGLQLERYPFRVPELDGRPTVLTVASLQPYKGIEYLVRASALLRDRGVEHRCLVVGGGELREPLQRLIDELGIGSSFTLLGPQTEDQVAGLLREADLFVLPSVVEASGKKEGLPVALMEALASGLPTVATAISGIPELVNDETGTLVPERDEGALADAIEGVLRMPGAALERARRGRELVEREFDLEHEVRKLAGLFESVGAK